MGIVSYHRSTPPKSTPPKRRLWVMFDPSQYYPQQLSIKPTSATVQRIARSSTHALCSKESKSCLRVGVPDDGDEHNDLPNCIECAGVKHGDVSHCIECTANVIERTRWTLTSKIDSKTGSSESKPPSIPSQT